MAQQPIDAKGWQLTASLTSFCPQTKVRNHSVSLGAHQPLAFEIRIAATYYWLPKFFTRPSHTLAENRANGDLTSVSSSSKCPKHYVLNLAAKRSELYIYSSY